MDCKPGWITILISEISPLDKSFWLVTLRKKKSQKWVNKYISSKSSSIERYFSHPDFFSLKADPNTDCVNLYRERVHKSEPYRRWWLPLLPEAFTRGGGWHRGQEDTCLLKQISEIRRENRISSTCCIYWSKTVFSGRPVLLKRICLLLFLELWKFISKSYFSKL